MITKLNMRLVQEQVEIHIIMIMILKTFKINLVIGKIRTQINHQLKSNLKLFKKTKTCLETIQIFLDTNKIFLPNRHSMKSYLNKPM